MTVPQIEGLTDFVEIGRGGFGVVYRAEQASAGRRVAVKVLLEAMLDERGKTRFAREAAAMGALSGHPNIVQLLQSGFTSTGDPYLVMPFMVNGSLADRLASGPIPWRNVLAMGVKLCGGLESAHDAGVLHRDVKPDNVLFSKYREPLLADFGIARVANHATTKTGSITASVLYAPPEILDGGSPTPVSDVYSLAATLYEALNGRPAFASDTDESVGPLLVRIMSAPPADLRPAGVPEPLWGVIAGAMAKDPRQRPPSAKAFGEALRQVQAMGGLSQTAMTVPDAPVAASAPAPPAPPRTGPQSGPYPGQQSGPYTGQQSGPYPGQQSGPYPGQQSGPYPGQQSGPYPGQQSGPYPGQQSGPYTGQQSGPYRGPAQGPPTGTPVRVIVSYLVSIVGIIFSPIVGGWGVALAYWARSRGEGGAKGAIVTSWVCLAASFLLYAAILSGGE